MLQAQFFEGNIVVSLTCTCCTLGNMLFDMVRYVEQVAAIPCRSKHFKHYQARQEILKQVQDDDVYWNRCCLRNVDVLMNLQT